MAHTYSDGDQFPATANTTSTANPFANDITLAAGVKILCVMLIYAGSSDRSGGAPTYNGLDLTQADTSRRGSTGPECTAEIWYLLNPPTGSAYSLSVPNGGTVALKVYWGAATVAVGKTSAYDTANGAGAVGTNPTVTLTNVTDGAIVFNVVANGAQSWSTTARTGTLIGQGDLGAWGGGAQYLIKSGTGDQIMAWTFGTSEDYGIISAAFKEIEASSPSTYEHEITETKSLGIAFTDGQVYEETLYDP